MKRSGGPAVLLLLVAGLAGCLQVTSVEPNQLSISGYTPVQIHGSGFSGLAEGQVEVTFSGVKAVNVHILSDSVISCVPQGAPGPVVVDVKVRDKRAFGGATAKAGVLEYVDTAYPQFRNVYNFGPSLSAGVTNMGYEPAGQINSIPGFVARQLGLYFPQRIVIPGGIPPIDAPNEVSLLFIGDGVRECWIPAINKRYVPAVGELCDPVVVNLDSIPIVDLALGLVDQILAGVFSGEGLASGLFQDSHIENRNYAIPGEQMSGYVFGTKLGFNYLQDFFNDPASPIRNPFCSGEPVVKRIADLPTPADLVIGYDWFFDSVLFSHPPEQDLLHQLLFAMLALSNSQYYAGDPCPAGTNDGTWRVPLISTDGNKTRTYQPYEGLPETCQASMVCPGAINESTAAQKAKVQEIIQGLGDIKHGYVVDWIALGLMPPEADTNGNGFIDIDFHNPANNELTPQLVANIIAADNPADNPKAVVLSTMPWPSASSSGQGGDPGGGDDLFAELVNGDLAQLAPLVDQAFSIVGRANPIVMVDTFGMLQDIFNGNRPDLTHGLDGDPSTQELFYEYELDPLGNPLKRSFTRYGGVFSMDHLHMSQTMNASSAYTIVEALNAKFGMSIPLVDLPEAWREDPYNHLKYDPTIQCAYQGINCP